LTHIGDLQGTVAERRPERRAYFAFDMVRLEGHDLYDPRVSTVPAGTRCHVGSNSGAEMAIKVYKVADIVGNHVMFCGQPKLGKGDLAAVLTNLQPSPDPNPECSWKIELELGEGPAARRLTIDLPPFLAKSAPTEDPLFLGEHQGRAVLYFRDHLFMPERLPRSTLESDEVTLRIKKATYDEQFELSSLRASVANLEAAIEYQQPGSRRDPIPDEVKLVVWARDGGSCRRCGSKHDLHFDHIIPVAKGGGNMEANIQILCQTCNLRKSDKIAIT
jgi:hypothetical protein